MFICEDLKVQRYMQIKFSIVIGSLLECRCLTQSTTVQQHNPASDLYFLDSHLQLHTHISQQQLQCCGAKPLMAEFLNIPSVLSCWSDR